MNKLIRSLLVVAVGSLIVPGAQAALLGTYTFAGADPAGDASVPSAANMTFGGFSRVNVTASAVNDVFRRSAWTTGGARDTTEYVQFTLTPSLGHSLNLANITFDEFGNNQRPRNGFVEIFLGTGLTSMGTQAFSPATSSANVNFDFSDFTTGNNEVVTIRFYGWNASNGGGQLSFDNVAINGSVLTAVPEPINMALGVFGVCVAGCGVGRRVYARVRS